LRSLNSLEERELIAIGRIARVHGIHGRLRVVYYNEDKTRFSSYKRVLLKDREGRLGSFRVEEARIHGKFILLSLEGVDSIDQAERLVGSAVLVERADLPDLERGEYYWADLIGMEVTTPEGERVGEVCSIVPTGGTDVIVIGTGKEELLVPATENWIRGIDTASKRMVIEFSEDLVE